MSSQEFNQTIALLGVITGLIGSASALLASSIAVLTYRREGALVKIKVRNGWQLMNAAPPYSEDKLYTCMTVYNRGRRHTSINQVGESYLIKSGGGIYSDSMIYGTRKLDEEGATDFLAEEKPGEKRQKVGYYYANTRAGKTYKYYPYGKVIYLLCLPMRKADARKNKLEKQSKDKVSK